MGHLTHQDVKTTLDKIECSVTGTNIGPTSPIMHGGGKASASGNVGGFRGGHKESDQAKKGGKKKKKGY